MTEVNLARHIRFELRNCSKILFFQALVGLSYVATALVFLSRVCRLSCHQYVAAIRLDEHRLVTGRVAWT